VEQHLDSMLQPSVQLRSGGYLVINQTEALVAIDVNSGRATRERSIEDTALRTNLEAADEVARQLRLRDLAGLIVIDFIDMESRRNNAAVERRLKDALRNDRARIQVGSISAFGLMEMSRQRLRPSLAESSFVPCPHCNGSGYMRGTESSSLHVLRAIEEEAAKRRSGEILVHVATPVALYVLNHKRLWLREIETRHHLVVNLAVDDTLVPPGLRIEKLRPYAPPAEVAAAVEEPERTRAPAEARRIPISDGPRETAEPDASEDESETAAADAEQGAEGDGERGRKRRRRRRRGGRRENGAEQGVSGEAPAAADEEDDRPGEEADDATPSLAPGESLDSPSVFADGDGEGAAPVVAEAGTGESGDRRGRRRRGGRNRNRFGGDRDLPARDGEARDRDDHVRDGSRDGERAPQRAYSGPTPADPFAGSYDIFAMMETDGEESGALLPDPSASAASLGAAEPGADGSRDVPEREAEILPPVATTSEPSTPAVAEPLGTAAEDPDAMPEAKLPPTSLAQTPAVQTGEPDMIAPDTLGAEPVAADAATADAVPAKPARVTRARKPKDAKEPKEPKPAKEPRAPRARRSKAAAVTDAAGPATDGVAPDATDTAVAETAAPAPVAAEAPAEPAAVPPTEPDAGTAGSRDPSIVQPTVIGDAPAPARRTGWWKR
ncbi:MAG: ribonuclease E/G, partial [Gluconacetobacter diazotrophicus]|nr:ribonuclease E/G [Gluconacetobacter diazotrophicus]